MPVRPVCLGCVYCLVVAGCVGPRQALAPPAFTGEERGVVLVADGAGDFSAASAAFRRVITQAGTPLAVARFEWSHGPGRIIRDQTDFAYARQQGQRLARQIAELREQRPDYEIYVAGHSAGCTVALAAAEALPPGSVERLILLSPSVSADYDVRPALRCVRQSVDVFHSPKDRALLGIAVALVGTADRCWWAPTAGVIGFRNLWPRPGDAELYKKLVQHCWHPEDARTGHRGGHYGAYQPDYLRTYVLPLLSGGGTTESARGFEGR